MSSEWREVRLGEVVTLKRGYDLPKKDRRHGKYPILAANGVTDFHNDFKVKGPGVTTGRSGTLGEVYFIQEDYWPLNTTLYVQDFHGNDRFFVYYFLKTIDFANFNAGSSVPTLNRNHVHSLPVRIPNLNEQKIIGEVLFSIDQKIELNNQINQNLEAMAQAIFRSWFVDFEPFQDGEFVESELGMIPKGWEVVSLSQIAEVNMGVSPKSSSYNEEKVGFPLVNGASDYSGTVFKPRKYTTEPKKLSKKNDVIICVRATIGNVVFSDNEYALGRGVAGIRAHESKVQRLIYLILQRSVDQLVQNASGSVFLNLTKPELLNLKIALPPNNVLGKISALLEGIFIQIQNNDKQSQTLATLRDTLLPKLMSGEIRVPLDEGSLSDELQRI